MLRFSNATITVFIQFEIFIQLEIFWNADYYISGNMDKHIKHFMALCEILVTTTTPATILSGFKKKDFEDIYW